MSFIFFRGHADPFNPLWKILKGFPSKLGASSCTTEALLQIWDLENLSFSLFFEIPEAWPFEVFDFSLFFFIAFATWGPQNQCFSIFSKASKRVGTSIFFFLSFERWQCFLFDLKKILPLSRHTEGKGWSGLPPLACGAGKKNLNHPEKFRKRT